MLKRIHVKLRPFCPLSDQDPPCRPTHPPLPEVGWVLLGPVLDIDSGGGGGGLLRPPGSSVIRQSPLGLRKISTTYLVDFKTQISTFLKNKYIKNVLIFQIKYLFEFKIYLFFKKVLIRSILNRNLVPFCDFCDFCDFYTYDQRIYLFEVQA